ncbi:uncharacterized protein [Antedon mediterranea]|uniref:uncharacterized protein n=1 Tax=Antedon mediterranea TaxID=105859 RepID=UPI003AF70C9C
MWWVRVVLLSVLFLVAVKGDSESVKTEESGITTVSRPDINLDVKTDSSIVSPQNIITSNATSDKVKLCCRRRRRRCCRRRRRCCRRRCRCRRRRRCRCRRRRYRCRRRRRCRCRRRRYRCRRRRRVRCRRRRYRCRKRRRFRCKRRRYRCRRRRRGTRPITRPIRRLPTNIYYTFSQNTLYCNTGRGSKFRVRYRWGSGRLFAYVQGRWQLVRKYGQYGAKYTFNGSQFVISGHWRPVFYFSWKGRVLYLRFRCGRQVGHYHVRYRWRGRTLYYFDGGRWFTVSKYSKDGVVYCYSNGRYAQNPSSSSSSSSTQTYTTYTNNDSNPVVTTTTTTTKREYVPE